MRRPGGKSGLPTKTYPVYDNYQLYCAWLLGSAADSRKFDFTWDEKKTRILSAKLYGKIATPVGSNAYLKFNDNMLMYALGTYENVTIEDTKDIIGILRNGANTVWIEIRKWLPIARSATFTATIIIEYEGEAPEEKAWWEKYIMPALAIMSVMFGAIGIGQGLRRD